MTDIPYKNIIKRSKSARYDEAIILVFVFFNAFLCLMTSIGLDITSKTVVLTQALAFVVLIGRILTKNLLRKIDLLLLSLLFICTLTSFLFDQTQTIKIFFDIFVIPVAFIYGLRSGINAWKIIKIAFVVNAGFLLLELISPNSFLYFFPVGEYYVNTRDWVAGQSINLEENSFYAGAERAGGGYFTSGHRYASLMLDPLTLGYLMVLVAAAARLNCKSKAEFIFYAGISLVITLLTDSRASLLVLAIIITIPLNRFTLRVPYTWYICIIWAVIFLVWYQYGWALGEFNYRLGYTFDSIVNNNLISFFGLGDLIGKKNDSGYLYLFDILGVPVLFLGVLYFEYHRRRTKNPKATSALLFLILFSTITLFFGQAVLSGKIAVIWGAFAGSMLANTKKDTV